MEDVNVSKIENVGGWFNIEIATVGEVVSSPIILTNTNSNQVNFESNGDDLDILPIGDTIVVNESKVDGSNGVEYRIDIRFEINKQSALLDDYFEKFLYKDVVVIGIKRNGDKKMYGSKKYPLMFNYDNANGNRFEDSNQIGIRITGTLPQKPVYVLPNTTTSDSDLGSDGGGDSDFESA
jgi:hypothetical protein